MKTKSKPESRRRNLSPITPVAPATVSFPILGLGTSAGGLEALEHFLGNVPKNSGMAFVIVQHLDPTRRGIMPEPLQRATGMKAIQVKDGTKVQPNGGYVIPGDVGRPITDLASDLLYPELPDHARNVLQKLGFAEKPVNASDGRWFTVRIMPYRTLDDQIDGLVITFADITAAKNLEAQLRAKHATLEKNVAKQATSIARAQGRGPAKNAESKPKVRGGKKTLTAR